MANEDANLRNFDFKFEAVSKAGVPPWLGGWLKRLLTEWAVACDRLYSAPGSGGMLAYALNEQANVSLIHGAASRLGMLAVSELPIVKKRSDDRRQRSDGRLDLLVCDEDIGEWIGFEAKIRPVNGSEGGEIVKAAVMESVEDCARVRTRDCGYLGVSFLCAKLPRSMDAKTVEQKLKAIKDAVVAASPHFVSVLKAIDAEETLRFEGAEGKGEEFYWPAVVISVGYLPPM